MWCVNHADVVFRFLLPQQLMCIVNLSLVCGSTWLQRYETLKELIRITIYIVVTGIILNVNLTSGNAVLYSVIVIAIAIAVAVLSSSSSSSSSTSSSNGNGNGN